MDGRQAYDELLRRSRERSVLSSCSALLGWDEQTYMPMQGSELRARQQGLLAGLLHERGTDPILGELLATAEGSPIASDPGSAEAANVREWRRSYDRQRKLPRLLVEELAETASLAQQHWVEAKRERDFARFRGWLERIVLLKQREAACLQVEGGSAYDALLDDYEPGATVAGLDPLFRELETGLLPLVTSIVNAPRKPDRSILRRSFPVDRQRLLGETVAAAVGFDFRAGRLDVSAHPFCTGIGPGDCRITTRYREEDFEESFFGVLHEVGHGLYEQGLDPGHHGTPMGEAVSLGVHESQSRLWENLVGRSRAFWRYWFPTVRGLFHEAVAGVKEEEFHRSVNHVEPSLIRTQADEATYNLHIAIRYELERALLGGELSVEEVPQAWNERYRKLLGIVPEHDGEGCLQDIHWAAGLFGYFPTYTLGNLYATSIYEAAKRDLGGLEHAFERGEFTPLREWLREKVHREGSRLRPNELLEHVCGARPSADVFVSALRERLAPLYDL